MNRLHHLAAPARCHVVLTRWDSETEHLARVVWQARVHCSLNINTETGRLSARRPNLQNQPALEKDRYRVRT